jgi:hypothetical protein
MGLRIATPRLPHPVLEYALSRLQPAGRISKWTAFVAGLWSRRVVRFAALTCALLLPGCSELAQPSEAAPPAEQPAYVSLVAQYLQSSLKDRSAYDAFEISALRWVDANKGWSWLACVHFHDHGVLRSYALFIQNNTVADARFAVETDSCDTQSYTQFDLVTGVLGRPTAPVQPALY